MKLWGVLLLTETKTLRGGNQMLKVDGIIYDINRVISRNISTFDASARGLLSQNVLDLLRNFIEYIV